MPARAFPAFPQARRCRDVSRRILQAAACRRKCMSGLSGKPYLRYGARPDSPEGRIRAAAPFRTLRKGIFFVRRPPGLAEPAHLRGGAPSDSRESRIFRTASFRTPRRASFFLRRPAGLAGRGHFRARDPPGRIPSDLNMNNLHNEPTPPLGAEISNPQLIMARNNRCKRRPRGRARCTRSSATRARR